MTPSAATDAATREAAVSDRDVSEIDGGSDEEDSDAGEDTMERSKMREAVMKARTAHAQWKSGLSDVITLINAVRAYGDAVAAADVPQAAGRFCAENFLRAKVRRRRDLGGLCIFYLSHDCGSPLGHDRIWVWSFGSGLRRISMGLVLLGVPCEWSSLRFVCLAPDDEGDFPAQVAAGAIAVHRLVLQPVFVAVPYL